MSNDRKRESILIADCGSTTTKVVLLDIVSGQYRFIAKGQSPTTAEPHWLDVCIGVKQAIAQIETITDRNLVDENGNLLIPSQGIGTGVDLFIASVSAPSPLKLVLAGLMEDVSLASARKIAHSTYTTIEDVISLADNRSDEEMIHQIKNIQPDVFLITGGTDGGATERVIYLVETISTALSLMTKKINAPTVIYAGNPDLDKKVAKILGEVDLRITDNVRPQVDVEYLEPAKAELLALYEGTRLMELPGAPELSKLTEGAIYPTAKTFGWTIHYLGKILKNNIIGVDVGSSSVVIANDINGKADLFIRSDIGIGHHLTRLLKQTNLKNIVRWLPFEITADELLDYIADKTLYPHTIPTNTNDLLLDLALARELIRVMVPAAFSSHPEKNGTDALPPVGMILASGAVLTNVPKPGQAALALLDALQPVGVCTLALDTQNLATTMGACATAVPAAMVQILEYGAFQVLGGVVAPIGQANPGEIILQLTMAYDNGSELEVEVEYDSLEVLPLPMGQQAELTLKPLKRFNVGAGPGRRCRRRVNGGVVGLIVDARGRPLDLPSNPDERRAKMQQWLWDVGA
ncbi:MAG: glutamate mutase L [Anaerolineales bacterium]|nr:glutamate mutase L [Anaerolineales bacterium]